MFMDGGGSPVGEDYVSGGGVNTGAYYNNLDQAPS